MHGNTENLVIPNGNTEVLKFLYPENSGILNSRKIPIPELQYSRREKIREWPLPSSDTHGFIKVHMYILRRPHNLQNLLLTFDYSTYSQKLGEDFAKFCGLLRIYELYLLLKQVN